jgi:hypothetical protein
MSANDPKRTRQPDWVYVETLDSSVLATRMRFPTAVTPFKLSADARANERYMQHMARFGPVGHPRGPLESYRQEEIRRDERRG